LAPLSVTKSPAARVDAAAAIQNQGTLRSHKTSIDAASAQGISGFLPAEMSTSRRHQIFHKHYR
jgi:hypothetical protein